MKILPSPFLSSSFLHFLFIYLMIYGRLIRNMCSKSRFMWLITLATLHSSGGGGKREVEEKSWETGAEGKNPEAPQILQKCCRLETSLARILSIHECKKTFWKGRHAKGSYFYFVNNGLDTLDLITIFKWGRVWQLDSHTYLKSTVLRERMMHLKEIGETERTGGTAASFIRDLRLWSWIHSFGYFAESEPRWGIRDSEMELLKVLF